MATNQERTDGIADTQVGWRAVLVNIRDNITTETTRDELVAMLQTLANPCERALCDLYHGVGQTIDPVVCRANCELIDECQGEQSIRKQFTSALRAFHVSRDVNDVIAKADACIAFCDTTPELKGGN